MNKYISADEIKNDIKTLWDWETIDGITSSTVLKQVLTDIDNINEAIVRCKDCKYYTHYEWIDIITDEAKECYHCDKNIINNAIDVNPEDYCSRGERKEINS